MTKEALKLALEALIQSDSEPSSKQWKRETEAITAIKEALAQPEQKPVAKNEEGRITWLVDNWPQNCLLYAEPPLWTPVEIGVDVTNEGTHVVGMYVLMPDVVRHVFYSKFHPTPQRKPLTDKEINALWFKANDQDNSMIKHFARAIEAAHGIKGEA